MPAPVNNFAPALANVSKGVATGVSTGVSGAIRAASDATGADFDYLYKVAARESSLDPSAKAKTSSATGLFQFIDQTWLGAVKQYGAKHGMGAEAAAIKEKAGGGYTVDPAAARQAVLDMRLDPQKSAALAGELAQENKRYLEGRLGRAVHGAELYAAHFLGPSGAAKLLSAPADQKAATLLPTAAKANRAVFYDGAHQKSVADIVKNFEKTVGDTATILKKDRVLTAGELPRIDRSVWGAPASFAKASGEGAASEKAPGAALPPASSSRGVRPAHIPAVQSALGSPNGLDPANFSMNELEAVIRRYSGAPGFSPIAAMVMQMIDPSTMRSGS